MRPVVSLAVLSGAALLLLHTATHDALRAPPPAPVAAKPSARSLQPPTPERKLASRRLLVPVKGIAPSQLRDNFLDKRGKARTHNALDIMAAWGTPVVATDDGKILRISRNRAGGLAVYQADASGQFVYYYAHLAGYEDNLREGQAVRRGDVIGYVGTTGNAPDSAPHLHFAVQSLSRDGRWWKSDPINPFEALRGAQTDAPNS